MPPPKDYFICRCNHCTSITTTGKVKYIRLFEKFFFLWQNQQQKEVKYVERIAIIGGGIIGMTLANYLDLNK
ncbi:MAG: hypothetical protein E6540_13095, partial [Enterococcus sp.]|nr:hypothetical protein [Enterococcus sp.]